MSPALTSPPSRHAEILLLRNLDRGQYTQNQSQGRMRTALQVPVHSKLSLRDQVSL